LSSSSVDGTRAAWISVVLIVVSVPHVIEDFTFREFAPIRAAAILAVCTIYAAQLIGAWLALRSNPWGGRLIALTGAIWIVRALGRHGHDIMASGLAWRFGLVSIGDVVLIGIVAGLALWYGGVASFLGRRQL
jgi:hypothetical protein